MASSGSAPNILGSTAPPQNIQTLVNAGKTVEEVIKRDQAIPDLANILAGTSSSTYVEPLISDCEEFLLTNNIPVPATILAKLDGMQMRCFFGILPEIGRAWVSVDENLYIWSYTNPNTIYEYKDQDQVIVGVGLVKPKPNIFGKDINYLLIVSTPIQVIMLALTVKPTEFRVYATEMVAPADNVLMSTIVGTDEGRIFMVGKNGNVYEFVYNHPDNWFGSKCYIENKSVSSYTKYLPSLLIGKPTTSVKSLAVDNERKVLYLLSDTAIELIYLGDSSNNYQPITKNTTIIETAGHMCRQTQRAFHPEVFALESLHIISKAESRYVHLMAITAAGFRLYFTHYKDGFRNASTYMNPPSEIPNALEMGHIRVPATPLTQTPGEPSLFCSYAYYDCGITLTVRTVNEDIDSINMTSLAHHTINTASQQISQPTSYIGMPVVKSPFVETYAKVQANGKAWALAESNAENRGKRCLKEITQQLSEPPRQFMVFTNRSLLFYNKLRPVDVLYRIFIRPERTIAEEQKECQSFFERYGKVQSCAMCLSIICNIDDPDVVNKAKKLFFELGGVPTAASATQAPGNHLGQVIGQIGVNYSGRHDGFVLYFARLVASIWHLKVFANRDPKDPKSKIEYAKVQRLLYDARGNLEKLKRFMDVNPNFHDSANIADPRFQTADRTRMELDLAEQKSIHEMYLLLTQCIGAVYFIEFLLDSGVQNTLIPEIMPVDYLKHVFDLDVNTMLTTSQGRELSRELVIATIARYGGAYAPANFNIVSSQLERWCTCFFSKKDILFFKGMEYLKVALATDAEYERRVAIKQSLNSFKEAADQISLQNLKTICDIYIQFAFHVGIIELALERAKKQDPQNLALLTHESPQYADESKVALSQARMDSYNFALHALNDVLLIRSQQLPPNRTPISDPKVYARNVIDAALKYDDQLFHYTLYNWLMEKNMQEELSTIDTPYLIPYFQKHVADEKSSLEFLWVHYRNKEEYFEAAKCLRQLAHTESPTLTLSDRLKYLSYAATNAQSAMAEGNKSQYLPRLYALIQEDIRVCKLQERVQSILRSQRDNAEVQWAADNLDRGLFSRVELWKEYGSRFLVLQHVFETTAE